MVNEEQLEAYRDDLEMAKEMRGKMLKRAHMQGHRKTHSK